MIEENEYYLQDRRTVAVGNCILFWAKDRKGYTCDLDRAHVFTKEEAFEQHRSRKTDQPWPKRLIDSLAYRHMDVQRLPKKPLPDNPSLPQEKVLR